MITKILFKGRVSKYKVHIVRYLNNILYSRSLKITIDSYMVLLSRSREQRAILRKMVR